jgi:hypothetical protein
MCEIMVNNGLLQGFTDLSQNVINAATVEGSIIIKKYKRILLKILL